MFHVRLGLLASPFGSSLVSLSIRERTERRALLQLNFTTFLINWLRQWGEIFGFKIEAHAVPGSMQVTTSREFAQQFVQTNLQTSVHPCRVWTMTMVKCISLSRDFAGGNSRYPAISQGKSPKPFLCRDFARKSPKIVFTPRFRKENFRYPAISQDEMPELFNTTPEIENVSAGGCAAGAFQRQRGECGWVKIANCSADGNHSKHEGGSRVTAR